MERWTIVSDRIDASNYIFWIYTKKKLILKKLM